MKKQFFLLIFWAGIPLLCMEQAGSDGASSATTKPTNTSVTLCCTDGTLTLDPTLVKRVDLPVFNAARDFGGFPDTFRFDEIGVSRAAVTGLLNLVRVRQAERDIRQAQQEIASIDVKCAGVNPIELCRVADFLLCAPEFKKELTTRLYKSKKALHLFGNHHADVEHLDELKTDLFVDQKEIEPSSNSEQAVCSGHYVCFEHNNEFTPRTYIIDRITGQEVLTVDGQYPVISPNEEFIAVHPGKWQDTGGIVVWNLKTKTRLGDFGRGVVSQFSPDSTLLCCYLNEKYHVWDVRTQQEKFEVSADNHTGKFVGNNYLKIGTRGPQRKAYHQKVFDLNTGKCVVGKRNNANLVLGIDDGRLFATVCNGHVQVTDINGRRILVRPGVDLEYEHQCLDITLDGELENNAHEIWHMGTVTRICSYTGRAPTFSPNGEFFFIERNDQKIAVFTAHGDCVLECPRVGRNPKIGDDCLILSAHDKTTLIDLHTQESIEIMGEFLDINEHTTLFAVIVDQKEIQLWDLKTKKIIKRLSGHNAQFLEGGEDVLCYTNGEGATVYFPTCDEEFFSDKMEAIEDIKLDGTILSVDHVGGENDSDDGNATYHIDIRKPAVRLLIKKLILQKGILSEQERRNLHPVYTQLSEIEKNTVVNGRTIKEIFGDV